MTAEDLEEILKKTEYPVAEDAFQTPQRCPYIAFLEQKGINTFADNMVWSSASGWRVELYRGKKDRAARLRLERELNRASICWERESTYIQEERCLMDIYEFTEME